MIEMQKIKIAGTLKKGGSGYFLLLKSHTTCSFPNSYEEIKSNVS